MNNFVLSPMETNSFMQQRLIRRLQHCLYKIEHCDLDIENIQPVYSILTNIISSLTIAYKAMPKTLNRLQASIEEIEQLTDSLATATTKDATAAKMNKLKKILVAIRSTLHNESTPKQNYNSENYYTQELARLATEKQNLESTLKEVKDKKAKQDITTEELQRQKDELTNSLHAVEAQVAQLKKREARTYQAKGCPRDFKNSNQRDFQGLADIHQAHRRRTETFKLLILRLYYRRNSFISSIDFLYLFLYPEQKRICKMDGLHSILLTDFFLCGYSLDMHISNEPCPTTAHYHSQPVTPHQIHRRTSFSHQQPFF